MNIFLLIFFLTIGILGLIYKVDTGVFVGLSLVPWQVIRLKFSEKINIMAIIITAVAGSIFFIYLQNWLLLGLFLGIELYNYWGHINFQAKNYKEETEKSAENKSTNSHNNT